MLKIVWVILVMVTLTACDAVAELDLISSDSREQVEVVLDAMARYESLPQGISDMGFPQIGDPDAPLEVFQISSFSCPFCADFYLTVFPELLDRVESGEVLYTYVPLYGIGSAGDGYAAALAGVCAAQQGMFYAFAEVMFSWQITYGDPYDITRLNDLVNFTGLDYIEWITCLTALETNDTLTRALEFADGVSGFTGTPSIVIEGQIVRPTTLDEINRAIDAALIGSL